MVRFSTLEVVVVVVYLEQYMADSDNFDDIWVAVTAKATGSDLCFFFLAKLVISSITLIHCSWLFLIIVFIIMTILVIPFGCISCFYTLIGCNIGSNNIYHLDHSWPYLLALLEYFSSTKV